MLYFNFLTLNLLKISELYFCHVLRFEGDKLYKAPLNLSIYDVNEDWTQVATITYPKILLNFCFINNDNITDILLLNNFKKTDDPISYSLNLNFGPIGDNTWVGTNIFNTNQIKYGDFDGNGYLDAFTSQNSNLKVSYNLINQFVDINSSNFSFNQIFTSKLNTNNLTDVFVSDGSNFYVSYDGVSSWNILANESYSYNDIIVEDFNQDNFSDVIDKVNYKVFNINTLYWSNLTTTDFPINNFYFGDF